MIDLLLEKDEKKRPKMKDILKMKSVIDRANKYNIELDIYDTIDEEKSIFKNKNKSENYEIDIKNNINKNNYSNYIKNSVNCNNNKELLKNSGKKDIYEKSPENNSNKAKKNKYENENKSNKLRIDNVIKNQVKQKNNNKIKSSLNKISNILNTKNKSLSNIQEDDSSFNVPGNQQQQGNNNINNNNQPPQYIKQFRDIINIDKLSNNNKIKFSSPNEINNRKLKESINKKGIKSLQTGNILQSGKIMNKVEKEKSEINNKKEISQESSLYNISNNSNRNNEFNIIFNKNNNSNIIENYYSANNNQSNYYYYKKDAILKKQQQQRNYLNKKDKDKDKENNINDNKKIKYSQKFSNLVSKSRTSSDLMTDKNQKISISEDKETIKENENYLSDENSNENNNNKEIQSRIANKIIIPSPLSGINKSTNNLKEFTLEKIPTQKLNNSFTLEQNKEHVKIYIESNNTLNEKSNSEVILENIKLQKLKDDTIKKIKKNESEMKSISYGVYQHVLNMYKAIEGDNKDITALTDSLQKYMRQNLIIKDDKDSEKLYKTFKKSFFNYILCEVELNNVEKQIEKRKIIGKWELNQNDNNNNMKNILKINKIKEDFNDVYGKPKNIYKK